MYFAIAWKNILSSEIELSLIWYNIKKYKNIFFFDTDKIKKIKNLAWFTKVWHLILKDDLNFSNYKIVWINKKLSKEDKLRYKIKRYKEVDLIKTDLEVKTKWVELLFLPWNNIWIVDYYQNISLYEKIDFERPLRSMNIGMMPSKLTHLLLNLATKFWENKTIYDPFVWLWTTIMIANYFWYNSIWSDLNITPCKQNIKWWKNTDFYNDKVKIFLFKQDVTKTFKNKIVNLTTNIVSEWFLWPVVGKYLNKKEAENLEKSFQNIYIDWIKNLLLLPNLENIVITFPAYFLINKTFYTFENTFEKLKTKWINLNIVDEIYHRKGQKVWRQIIIISK